MEIVEIDGNGRIYLPAHIRRKIKARRFKVEVVEGAILLKPVDAVDEYYGKFGPPKFTTLDEIEAALEDATQVDIR
ncbi:MAG: AbrB family transcriptional regulator [Pyrobaculum sp.]